MTDLNTNEVQVASSPNSTLEYKSIAPSILFGLIGAFFQVRNAKARGLTDTRRYWKAAWISTAVSFALSILLTVMMVFIIVAAVGKSSDTARTDSGNSASTSNTEQISGSEVAPAETNLSALYASAQAPAGIPRYESEDPLVLVNMLYEIRTLAFCTGNLDYLAFVWASPSMPNYVQDVEEVSLIKSGGAVKRCGKTIVTNISTDVTTPTSIETIVTTQVAGVEKYFAATLELDDGYWRFSSLAINQ